MNIHRAQYYLDGKPTHVEYFVNRDHCGGSVAHYNRVHEHASPRRTAIRLKPVEIPSKPTKGAIVQFLNDYCSSLPHEPT